MRPSVAALIQLVRIALSPDSNVKPIYGMTTCYCNVCALVPEAQIGHAASAGGKFRYKPTLRCDDSHSSFEPPCDPQAIEFIEHDPVNRRIGKLIENLLVMHQTIRRELKGENSVRPGFRDQKLSLIRRDGYAVWITKIRNKAGYLL